MADSSTNWTKGVKRNKMKELTENLCLCTLYIPVDVSVYMNGIK